jgi:hypothetical protein
MIWGEKGNRSRPAVPSQDFLLKGKEKKLRQLRLSGMLDKKNIHELWVPHRAGKGNPGKSAGCCSAVASLKPRSATNVATPPGASLAHSFCGAHDDVDAIPAAALTMTPLPFSLASGSCAPFDDLSCASWQALLVRSGLSYKWPQLWAGRDGTERLRVAVGTTGCSAGACSGVFAPDCPHESEGRGVTAKVQGIF